MKKIIQIEKDSIANEVGIEPGDFLVSVNNTNVLDVFDYRFLIADEKITLTIQKMNGETIIYDIEKEYSEDLGIIFESGMMDNARSCRNKCIFCFIDQLPQGMRDTLYFKDDDSRLSFLQGNYVTLTNMSDSDLDRIIQYHLSPINISVHTTNPKLRQKMLANPKAEYIMDSIKKLSEAGISLNFQVVLCKGVNDAEELDKTIKDLSSFMPKAESLSVVPVGLSKHRENLYPLKPFYKEDASAVLKQIHKHQQYFLQKEGTAFVYAADEFYLKAGEKLPKYKEYENFPQLENGVGMIRLMQREFDVFLSKITEQKVHPLTITLVTGESAYQFMLGLSKKIMNKFIGLCVQVISVKNTYFGENITVSGLLTGTDIINQLKNEEKLGDILFIPENALRAGSDVFLDNCTLQDVEEQLKIKVKSSPLNGKRFLKGIITEVVNEESNCSNSW